MATFWRPLLGAAFFLLTRQFSAMRDLDNKMLSIFHRMMKYNLTLSEEHSYVALRVYKVRI